jgi:hypothetical protein
MAIGSEATASPVGGGHYAYTTIGRAAPYRDNAAGTSGATLNVSW